MQPAGLSLLRVSLRSDQMQIPEHVLCVQAVSVEPVLEMPSDMWWRLPEAEQERGQQSGSPLKVPGGHASEPGARLQRSCLSRRLRS